MIIVNETKYETSHLRAFVMKIARDELTAAQRKILVVRIVQSKRSVSGFAFSRPHNINLNDLDREDREKIRSENYNWEARSKRLKRKPKVMKALYTLLRVPYPRSAAETEMSDEVKLCFASLVAHELHHCSGVDGTRSKEIAMRRSARYGWKEEPFGFRSYYASMKEFPVKFDRNVVVRKQSKRRVRVASTTTKTTSEN
jgi:hypothetical protein